MIASVLKGVISQRLVVESDGEGRVAICEVLRQTGARFRHHQGW